MRRRSVCRTCPSARERTGSSRHPERPSDDERAVFRWCPLLHLTKTVQCRARTGSLAPLPELCQLARRRHDRIAVVELEDLDLIGVQDDHLAVVATTRADGTVQASVVNAGLLAHPVSGEKVIAFVTYGKAKLANLRSRPRATIVFRAGWQWASAEGRCDIIGPDDPFSGFDPAALPSCSGRFSE